MDSRLPEVPYRPTLPELLRRAVALYGDSDFVVLPDRRLSFAEADELSAVLAKRLLAHGLGKGSRVGISLPTGIDWVIAWLAVARIGAMSMLLPSTYRAAELRRALRIGDVGLLIASRTLLGREYEPLLEEAVPGLATATAKPIWDPQVPFLRAVWMVEGSERPWATPVPPPSKGDDTGVSDEMLAAVEGEVSPADALLVIFTSGSSADPKAVVHTHGAAIRKIQPELGMCLPGSFPGRTFCAMPFFWVGGPQDLLGALHSGAAVVTQPRFQVEEALDLLERERCTSVLGWPNLLSEIRAHPTYPQRRLADLAVPEFARSSRGDPRNLGMTETFGPHANLDWFEYKVIDPFGGEVLPEGAEGEFCVRGFGLMSGFYKKEREEVFDADGWYHTGDRGYIDDGMIWFTGRYSEMIKSKGANVSPLEVEAVLQSIPGVSSAFVLGIPDPASGQAVAAAVVPERGATIDVDRLRDRTNKELSSYKVPSLWLVLDAEEVPLLANGKIDKRGLAERF